MHNMFDNSSHVVLPADNILMTLAPFEASLIYSVIRKVVGSRLVS